MHTAESQHAEFIVTTNTLGLLQVVAYLHTVMYVRLLHEWKIAAVSTVKYIITLFQLFFSIVYKRVVLLNFLN